MKRVKRVMAAVVAIATIVTIMAVPLQASASSWRNESRADKQSTRVICGFSCIYPIGMHFDSCPQCHSRSYRVLGEKMCAFYPILIDSVYYQYRQCNVCGARYKGPQYAR